MKVGRWSTTPGSNNATPPDGWPEGQAPSTLNDCAREMMAQLRTLYQDSQFVDQDLSPSFVNVTTFTVPGDQTSAIHSGRRLKVFDASTMFATVTTASFTAVTTIQIATDSGSNLTNSLSSFAIGILSRLNTGMPQGLSLSAAAVNVSGAVSVGTLVVGGTLSASAFAAPNIPKAWVSFSGSTTGIVVNSGFNVSSVSRSASSVGASVYSYRINFATPMTDSAYIWTNNSVTVGNMSKTAAAAKFGGVDGSLFNMVFYR